MNGELNLGGIIIPRGSDFAFNYKAAEYTRFRDWSAVSSVSSGEWASLPQSERNIIIARLRYLIRNNEYCAALASTFAVHLGNSTLRSKSPDKAYNDARERLWLNWSNAAEVSGLSLAEIEGILVTELLCAGEVFFLKLSTGQIQLIPSEWVFSGSDAPENEIQGIQYTATGIPTGYRIGFREKNGQLKPGQIVPAAQVIHLYKRERVEQLRGVPWLAAAASAIQDVAELTAAKILSVKAQSHLSAAIIKNGGGSPFPTLADNPNTSEAGVSRSRYATLQSGSLLYLEPGEDIKLLSAQYQTQDFEAFLLSRLRAIGATIGLPLELYLEGYKDSSFSSARATNLVWARKIRSVRSLIERRFLEPVSLWVTERARAVGTFKGSREFDGETSFNWPPVPSIDEQKETAANAEKLANGLGSYSSIYSENGLYFEDEIRTMARDAKLILEAANTEGVPVSMLIPKLSAPAPTPPAAPDAGLQTDSNNSQAA